MDRKNSICSSQQENRSDAFPLRRSCSFLYWNCRAICSVPPSSALVHDDLQLVILQGGLRDLVVLGTARVLGDVPHNGEGGGG